jgi:hypothetical protein
VRYAQAVTAALASLLVIACGSGSELPQSTPMPARVAIPEPPAATGMVESPLLLPGELRRETTIADLQALYGPDNVRVGDVPGPEGSTEQGAILFPDDPARRAYVYFHDDMPHDGTQPRRLASVQVFDPESRWQLERGVRIGMPFDALRSVNGKPFRFGGLGWDYGGYVDWNGGILARRDGDLVEIGVRLDAYDQAQVDADTYPIGEGVYSSDDPAWPRMAEALMVSQISVSFPLDAE